MKREPKALVNRAIDSLVLSMDHFNRSWDRGRQEAVLILLDRAFELLLKAAILHRGGKIREYGSRETIGFDKCVRKCLGDQDVAFLEDNEALTIQMINSLRDAAQHHLLECSEQQLYLFAQAGITLFADLLKRVFGIDPKEELPRRVLPISTDPPKDIAALVEVEFREIKELVRPGARNRVKAHARLRSLAVIEDSLSGVRSQPSEGDLEKIAVKISKGKSWQEVFPRVTTLSVDSSGSGIGLTLRISKTKGEPVQLVKEGTPGATIVAVHKVNELGFYTLGLWDVAEKVGLTRPKALALVKHLHLQESDEYYKEFVIGKVKHQRYSQKALAKLSEAKATVDMDEVWRKHGPKRGKWGSTTERRGAGR